MKQQGAKRSMLPLSEKNLEGASPDAPKFSAVREHCPPEKPFATCYSLIASRHSLSFQLGRSLALPNFCR